jgi:predicted small secreted protein
MKKQASILIILVILTALLSGCAMFAGKDTRVTSGQLLETVGQEFLSTHRTFAALCPAQAIPVVDCQKFDAFRVKFQKAYPVLVASWQKAVAAGTSTASVTEDLLRLKDELVIYTLLAQAKRSK